MMTLHFPPIAQILKRFMPLLLILFIGGSIILILNMTKKEMDEEIKVVQPRIVRVVEAVPSSRQIVVTSQGSVEPRVSIALQAEVSGRIVEVSEDLVAGGFFEEGDMLLRIDPRDYELAVVRAEARVAEARQRQIREEAESEQARKEWAQLGTGEASPLVLREPQLMEAEARLKSARADLAEANLRLERTVLRAPFTGRVTRKNVDIGQVVSAGLNAAEIYATDRLEVRLPLTDRQIALLDLPFSRTSQADQMPRVTLHAVFGGVEREWKAQIVRTEGVVHKVSRVVYAVASVEGQTSQDPPAQDATNDFPLTVGLFVEARISGRFFDGVVSIPRESVRQDGTVLVVGKDDRIHFRNVEVLQSTRDTSYVRLDISAGERICVSPIDTPIENMKVTVVDDEVNAGTNLAGTTLASETEGKGTVE
jgi:RND family efflux transporter MFP subunit